jgi:hypothetical protein
MFINVFNKIIQKLYIIINDNKFVGSNKRSSKKTKIKMLFFRGKKRLNICFSLKLIPKVLTGLNQ